MYVHIIMLMVLKNLIFFIVSGALDYSDGV